MAVRIVRDRAKEDVGIRGNRPADRLAVLAGTGLYTGFLPWAPGTWGTLLGIGCLWFAALAGAAPWTAGAAGLVLAFAAVPAASRCEKIFRQKDSPRIVLDEIAGICAAFAFVEVAAKPWLWIVGFLAFRLLDIVKPFPLRQLGKLPGGWGVLADDIAAGLLTNLLLQALAA